MTIIRIMGKGCAPCLPSASSFTIPQKTATHCPYKSAPTAAAVLHLDGEGASGWADRLLALRSVQRGHHFVNQYPQERDLQNDLMPQYPCHHIVKQT